MASDGKIVFEVTIDDKNVVTSIRDITNTIDKESKNWDQSTKSAFNNVEKSSESTSSYISAAFEGCFISIASSIISATSSILSAFGEWALAAIDMASDLEEVQNVVDVTFGEAGARKIETWAKKAGSQFGLTELQAKKFASTMGAMMKSSGLTGDQIIEMSEDLAGLAADMASFYNLDFETAFGKIRSGIAGETEPLKQLGINMSVDNINEFLKASGSEVKFGDMSQAEQMLTRYQYLMKATEDAQGDFVRTSADSYANLGRQIETQGAQLQTAFGKEALPIAKQWREDYLNFLKLLNGDTGVTVTGTKDQLTKRMEEQSAAAEQARTSMDELAGSYAELFDMEAGVYDSNFYKSFGEYFYETLRAQQPFAGGRQRERIDSILGEMTPFYEQIGAAETEVSSLQEQLNQLATETPDTSAAGAEIVSDLVSGLKSEKGSLQAEVNAINFLLSSIGSASPFASGVSGSIFIPQHETGLSRVPYDGYLASLHEGEGILTAEENRVWHRFKNGQGNGFDYDTMGGVMRDNIKPGGNVYLDGRIVGSVISDQQGKSFRQLQRSGWQG